MDTAEEKALGDPGQLRSAARSWAGEAETYNTQVTNLTRVQQSLPSSAFTGRKGDQMRLFLSDTIKTTTALRAAYQQIGNAAPFVADAIQDAKTAMKARTRAQHAAQAARHESADARGEAVAAAAALAAAKARQTADSLLGRPGAAGDLARAQHAYDVTQRRLERAERELERAERKYRNATDEFDDAQRSRERKSAAFAHLLREQSAIIDRTLPSAPPAPSVAPVLSTIKVLGYGRQAFKGIADLETMAIRSHYGVPERVSFAELRRIRVESGQPLGQLLRKRLHRGGSFGPLTESQSSALSQIEKWGGRLSKANTVLSLAGTFGSNTAKILHDPNLSAQEKQDEIVNRTLLEFGGGYAGGALCAPGGLAASAACGYLGTEAGKVLEKSRTIRRATNGLSHIVVNPVVDAARESTTSYGLPTRSAWDDVPRQILLNAGGEVVDTVTHPEKIGDAAEDVGADFVDAGGWLLRNVVSAPPVYRGGIFAGR